MKKVKGILFSFILGIVASLPWIILNYFGWFVSLAGYLIGLAAYKGYIRFNKNFDRVGKLTVAIVIIFAIPFAEMVSIFIASLQYTHNLFISLVGTPLLFFSYVGDFLPNILFGYLMAALGTYQFFIDPAKLKRHKNVKNETIQRVNIKQLIKQQISLVINTLISNGHNWNEVCNAEFSLSGITENLKRFEEVIVNSEFEKNIQLSTSNILVLSIQCKLNEELITNYAYKLYDIAEKYGLNYEGFKA